MTKLKDLSDTQIDKLVHLVITGECWHKLVEIEGYPNRFKCALCGMKKPFWINYAADITKAMSLVEKLKDRVIDNSNKGIDVELNYNAFASQIKTSCLLAGSYAKHQKHFEDEELFLLYLIKPRQLVEACLLAVETEDKLIQLAIGE